MSSLLTNNSFLSSLKRHRAVRNRSNNVTPTPSKRTNRLPVLPEDGENELFSSYIGGVLSTALPPIPSPRSTSSKEKRPSRYGKDKFAVRGASTITNECPSPQPRIAPRDPSLSIKQMHRSVRLSTFDMILDIPASEPASPVSETSSAFHTPPRPCDQRPSSLNRTRSPTPSLTSVSACSSTDMPTTPGGSDDEWPSPPRKTVARPPISTHPFAASKSTPSLLISEASPTDALEFTLESFFPLGPEDEEIEEEQEEEDEDDVLWYSRELGEMVTLCFQDVPSDCPARPDSLLPPPRSSSRRTNRLPRSRMSKPLPSPPRTPGPSSQMDPTFPRSKSRPPPMPLPPSPNTATYPSHLAPLAPAPTREPRRLPVPLASTSSPTPVRRPLSIVVPRALPRTSLPLDVSDILDDIDAWSFATPSTSTQTLSPPRVPSSAASSPFSAEYDPIELIVSYASQPTSPSSSTPTYTCAPGTASSLEEGDESAEVEVDWAADNDDNLRSRWSCSTLATLAASGSPPTTPTSTSARLRMHLGSVARLVRARRGGRANGSEDALAVPKAAAHLRCASESALSGPAAVCEEAARSGLQRKPIPRELFSRSQRAF